MDFPERSAGELYGLQNHRVVYVPEPMPDGRRYIVMSLHVTPIADSFGELRALPAVCLELTKAQALAGALAAAIAQARGAH